MKLSPFTALLGFLFLSACAGSKLEKEVRGDWSIAKIQHEGQFIPEGIWLKLEEGNRYSSGHDLAEVPHVGRWTIEEGGSLLVLDSDLGEEDDSQWALSMQGDTMILRGSPYDSTRVITMYMLKNTAQ